MSRSLVTLEQASDHLRIDDMDSAGNADLELKIWAASAAVLQYLGAYADANILDSSGQVPADSGGDPIVPDDIKFATLLLVGEFYKSREGEQEGEIPTQWGYGYLPRPVVALLYPYRTPTVA